MCTFSGNLSLFEKNRRVVLYETTRCLFNFKGHFPNYLRRNFYFVRENREKVRENRERFENSRKICWANDFSSRSIHSFLPSLIQNSDQNLPSVLTLKPAYLVNNSFSVIMSASTSSRSLQEKRIVMRRHGISSLEEREVIVHGRVYMLL